MSEYELVKKLGSYDNFKGLKSMAKVPRHKLFARNKLSAPTVSIIWRQKSLFWETYRTVDRYLMRRPVEQSPLVYLAVLLVVWRGPSCPVCLTLGLRGAQLSWTR